MVHRLIEGFHAAAGPRLHDPSLHHRQHKRRKAVQIAPRGKSFPRLFQAAPDGGRPSAKIGCDPLVRRQVVGLDFQRQAPQRAAILATGIQQAPAIALQNREDPADRIAFRRKGGLHDDRFQTSQVIVQHGEEQRFLPAGKEMVEAAGVGLRAMQNLRHSGGGVASFPEQESRRIQQPFAS